MVLLLCTASRMRRNATREPILTKFCTVVGIPHTITYTYFGDHRLRGFLGGGVEFSSFSICFHYRLYNTRTTARVAQNWRVYDLLTTYRAGALSMDPKHTPEALPQTPIFIMHQVRHLNHPKHGSEHSVIQYERFSQWF